MKITEKTKDKLTKHLTKLAKTPEERAELVDLLRDCVRGLRAGEAPTGVRIRLGNALLMAAVGMATPEQLGKKTADKVAK